MVTLIPTRFILLLFTAMLLAGSGLAQAVSDDTEVNASVDKNPVIAGETFVLTLTVNDAVSANSWQPGAELGAFRVLNTSTSSNTQIINGEVSRTTAFRTLLQAPAPGSYEIPAITLNNASSQPIELQVVAAGDDASQAAQRDVFMKASIDTREVYLQQQLKLNARLYLAANLQSGNIIPPQLDSAEISQLGSDKETYEIINGRRFQVFQRTYLITPQRSGELTIKGPVFNGQIAVSSPGSIFSSFSSTEQVTTATEDIPLTVLPVPDNWPADAQWLPVQLATLSLELAADDEEVSTAIPVGQPLTLTYRLTVVGVSPDQLPRLQPPTIENASVYAETPQSASTERNNSLIAQQVLTVAVIPRAAGTLTIPELRIPWFNTATGRIQYASTEPVQLRVTAPQGLQPAPPETPIATSGESGQPAAAEIPAAAQPEAMKTWWPMLAALFAILWLITMLIAYRLYQRQGAQRKASTTADHDQAPAGAAAQLKKIKQACEKNDAMAVEHALRDWAQQQLRLTDPSFAGIADHFGHTPFRSQLNHLSNCRYGGKHSDWLEGKALWRALQAAIRSKQKGNNGPSDDSSLPQLYPR
ncbi:BatD family protein [Pseudidiomarina sp.]|uniref:BatD family protein n=1 Tax=Pseudidiomarina sp. TaxID=2081707 RepID=UPI00299D9E74|nr:BatD family protein [Pseudidiomarina sp.]MDX1705029.1 BatD family protein [Pseudidiomarina sp.]